MRLGLETRELPSEEPVGESNPTAGKSEPDPLPVGQATRIVGADRGGDLRLCLL
jgi:hypothetical protein